MYIGCIADDFTGASDAASFFAKGGFRTLLTNGVPKKDFPAQALSVADAVVIALKSRALPAAEAVSESLAAADWLLDAGAPRLYEKYCSTFDSTEKGNIGPVGDALLKRTNAKRALVCPSLPANGRAVRGGVLYVNGVPLAESPMRFHPLNPMTKSRVKDLMEMQSELPAAELGAPSGLSGGLPASLPEKCYLIPDYATDDDGMRIAELFPDEKVYTGGSGLCEALARVLCRRDRKEYAGPSVYDFPGGPDRRFLILAGSCSEMTGKQIRAWKSLGLPAVRIDPELLLSDPGALSEWKRTVSENRGSLLLHSLPEEGRSKESRYTQEQLSAALDHAFEELSRTALASGTRRLLAAGGETSGAVCRALTNRFFYIGKSLAPGVPLLFPDDLPELHLALKSGNFGGEDFFVFCEREL